MIRRLCTTWLLGLSLIPALSHFVLAQSGDKQPTAVRDLIKNAVRAGSNKQFDEAVGYLDQALKQKPDDRDALDFMTLMAGLAADKAKDKAGTLAMLRKAASSFERIKQKFQPLSEDEEKLGNSMKIDAARIAALEGKSEQALNIMTKLVADGHPQAFLIDKLADFEPVRLLPDFAAKMVEAYKGAARSELASFKSYPLDFNLQTVSGTTVKSIDLKGNVAIVDVWGTWCPPCREEVPHLVDLANRYDGKGLKIVGINCNEEGSPAEVKKTINEFVATYKIPYPCAINKENDSIESKITGFEGYPTMLMFDRSGKLRLSLIGYHPPAQLEAIISILLAEPTS